MINMATLHRWGRVCSPSGWRSRSQLLSRILHAVEGRAAVLSSSRMQVARAQLLGGKSAVLRPPIRTGLTASRPPDDCRARRRAGRARSTLSTAERRRKGRARPSTPRSMVRCRERGLCAMIAPCRARASAPHARDARGGSIIGMGARDHFPPTRPFERANMFQVRTTPSGVHDLFLRGIPLIPLNPAESHLKLVFRSDREPAHVDGRHVGREETGIRVLCREIALAGERSEPPGSGMFAAIPNGVESTSFGCRKPGSTGLPTARYSAPATL